MIDSIIALPTHVKGACVSGSIAIGSFTLSMSTAVQGLQGIAAVVAIVSGAYSFYLAFTHKGSKKRGKTRKGKR